MTFQSCRNSANDDLRLVYALFLSVPFLFASACSGGGSNGGGTPPSNPTITSVTVTCTPTSIQTGQTSQCSATVSGTGSYSSAVTWSADSGPITSSGVYTAPSSIPASGKATITATSTQDSTKSGAASVTVTPSFTITGVSVSCNPTSVPDGGTSQCTATVSGSGNFDASVTWTASLGTIASTAQNAASYTAPSNGTASVRITAVSSADSTKSGSKTLNLTAAPPTAAFQLTGPNGGSFTALAADPTAPGTLYAYSWAAGAPAPLWKSSDSAQTWQAVSNSSNSIDTNIAELYTIAVAPKTGAVYAGGLGSTPLLTSVDRGITWTPIALPSGIEEIYHIAIDPLNDSTVYLIAFTSSQTYVLRSSDGGSNWSQLTASCSTDIEVDPKTEGTVYCTGSNGFFVSHDSGATWVNTGTISGMLMTRFAVAPASQETIFTIATIQNSTVFWLYSSSDGGSTWSRIPIAGYVGDVIVDAANPLNVYATTSNGLEASSDGGHSWSLITTSVSNASLFLQMPGAPSTFVGAFGTDLLRSQDGGVTWGKADQGIGTFNGLQVAADPNTPTTIYLAATNGGGVSKSLDGGTIWNSILGGDCRAIAIDPHNSNHALVACDQMFEETQDGGMDRTRAFDRERRPAHAAANAAKKEPAECRLQ